MSDGDSPIDSINETSFKRFMKLSDAFFAREGSTWKISLPRLYKLIFEVLTDELNTDEEQVKALLHHDYERSKQKGSLELLLNTQKNVRQGKANKRQQNHA